VLRRILAGAAVGSISASGCTRLGADLVVATDWTRPEIAELEAALGPLRVAWIRPTETPDPTLLVVRNLRADAVLGGPITVYQGLSVAGRLAAIDDSGEGPTWVVSRRSPLGWALADRPTPGGSDGPPIPTSWDDLGDPSQSGRVALGDPRVDPVTLACLTSRLHEGPWGEAYADLVRAAGRAQPIAGQSTSPLAELARGKADMAPTAEFRAQAVPGLGFRAVQSMGDWIEGAAILSDARNRDAARTLIRAVAERSGERPSTPPEPEADGLAEALLADLLGATLVDAQPELRTAIGAIERNPGQPGIEQARYWLVQPPPWPPASIEVLRAKFDGEALVNALAEQLTPDRDTRFWLIKFWEREERPIDGNFLADLADPTQGRLAGEPRFRAWLRGEWVAWARQRYRRAERLAEGRVERP
jgi:hypothetical protein